MGFLDKVKGATGIGLNADEQYQRAYEKGVFLQPPDYDSAAKQFRSSAEKYRKDGNVGRAHQAEVNGLLYDLVHKPDATNLQPLIAGLGQLPEIERIGTQSEMIATGPLATELQAIEAEVQANATTDLVSKSNAFRKAGRLVGEINAGTLIFSEILKVSGPTDKPYLRQSYYDALADYHGAFASLASSPEDAEDGLQRAKSGFSRAQAKSWLDATDGHIDAIKTKRHCWLCHREMQGRDHYFSYFPASVTPYHHRVVEQLKQDDAMLERSGAVTLCSVCGSAIENQADRYAIMRADEVRKWVAPILDSHVQAIAALQAQINRLEVVVSKK